MKSLSRRGSFICTRIPRTSCWQLLINTCSVWERFALWRIVRADPFGDDSHDRALDEIAKRVGSSVAGPQYHNSGGYTRLSNVAAAAALQSRVAGERATTAWD